MRFDETNFGGMNFIVYQQDFTGVLRITNFRDLNGFALKIELFKFLKSNQFLLENVIKQNEINPTDSKLIDRVATEGVGSTKIGYPQIRPMLDYLKQVVNWARTEGHESVEISFYNAVKVVLTIQQITQLYHVVDSFGKNYFILESIFNMVTGAKPKTDSLQQVKDDKVTNHVNRQPEGQQITKEYTEDKHKEYITEQQNNAPQNELETLLEYCFNQNLKNLVLHYTLNYYQYISDSSVTIDQNENVINVVIPNVLPYSLSMDSIYFHTYILSNNEVPLSSITTYASKLIQKVIFEGQENYWNNPMYMMIFTLILYVYSIRYLIELHPNVFDMQFESLVSNNDDLQKRVLQHYTSTFMKSLNLQPHENEKAYIVNYTVKDFNIDDQWSESKKEIIKRYSDKDLHIIPVSQEMFADKVLSQVKDEQPRVEHPDFKFSNKKIIDLNKLIKRTDRSNIKKTNLIDPKDTTDATPNDDIFLTNYLDYNISEDGAITQSYRMLMQYSKDPASLSLIKNIPTELINLFPVIANDILNSHTLPESMESTYDYYRIVVEKLPRPEVIKYTTIMFIVYQIIIPYYYAFYKKTIFKDYLI